MKKIVTATTDSATLSRMTFDPNPDETAAEQEEWKSPFPEEESGSANTSLGTLIGIGAGGLAAGVILVFWGLVAINTFGTGYPVQKDPGTTQLMLGSALSSIGITALLILAGVRAIIWHIDSRDVTPSK